MGVPGDFLVRRDDVSKHRFEPAVPLERLELGAAMRAGARARLGENLRASIGIGATHWDRLADGGWRQASDVTAFFGPARIAKGIADWGGAEFASRVSSVFASLAAVAGDPARPWFRIREERGPEAVARTYDALVAGRVDPSDGCVLSL